MCNGGTDVVMGDLVRTWCRKLVEILRYCRSVEFLIGVERSTVERREFVEWVGWYMCEVVVDFRLDHWYKCVKAWDVTSPILSSLLKLKWGCVSSICPMTLYSYDCLYKAECIIIIMWCLFLFTKVALNFSLNLSAVKNKKWRKGRRTNF